MTFKRNCLATAVAAALVAISAPALANGLAINEQSTSSAGTAYAGRASAPQDATTIYGNPAGLSRLKHTQISVGAAFIHATTRISDAHSYSVPIIGNLLSGTNKGDMVPNSTIPFLYFAQPLSDQVAWGLGIYVPFGVESDYENSFQGRLHGLHSLVKVITVQPTLSFKFNDFLSIGGGPTFSRIDGKLTNAVPGSVLAASQLKQITAGGGLPTPGQMAMLYNLKNAPDTHVAVKGDDMAAGYNIGVLMALTDNLDWGITYHSKLHFGLDGHANISSPIPGLGGTYDGKLALTLPESVDTALTWRVNDWTLSAGTTWTRWSRLQSIHVEGLPAALHAGATETLNWEDTWAWAVGGQYQLNAKWKLRIGVAGDPSPTSNQYRTVRIPVGNRHTITFGAGWDLAPNVTVDVAYAHIWEDAGKIDAELAGQPTYHAKFKNKADAVSAQLTWRF